MKQKELKYIHQKKLVQEVSTRWGSTFYMINSILINKSALIALSCEPENKLIADNFPTDNEFCELEELIQLLEPLNEITIKYIKLLLFEETDENLNDPLNFYKLNSSSFPILTRIAVELYCVQPTSVPAESLFSIAGLIQNDQKNRDKIFIYYLEKMEEVNTREHRLIPLMMYDSKPTMLIEPYPVKDPISSCVFYFEALVIFALIYFWVYGPPVKYYP
ncbi:unnamed protein product [Brachionus calyciflorus]|uniref:HAT C-terminal dimerisation domain-containing protein n=1 Tax=Brachionus calyciflorus TaxID=104777 RepID=A0A813ZU25_9BILA|nr:unnamed protein product [Brachionus calyciflorus]